LSFYSRHFNTVENQQQFLSTTATATTFDTWRESSPRNFGVCREGQPLHHSHEETERSEEFIPSKFFLVADRLEKKLGPILFQLPPPLETGILDRLEEFLEALPGEHMVCV